MHRAAGRSPSRAEAALASVLAVLAVLAAAAAVPVVWTRLTVVDTDRFSEVVDPLSHDPAVQSAIASLVADDVITALSRSFGSEGVTAGATRLVIESGIRALTGGVAFDRFWASASADVHDQFLDARREGGPSRISFSYIPLVATALHDAGDAIQGLLGVDVTIPDVPAQATPQRVRRLLERRMGIDLPDGFGSVVVYEGPRVRTLGRTVGWIQKSAILLPLLALVLAAAATAISPRRARTLAAIAFAVAVICGFEALGSRVVQDVAVTGVSTGGRPVAEAVAVAMRSSFVGFAQTVGLGALAVAVAALVAGAAARARLRRSIGVQ